MKETKKKLQSQGGVHRMVTEHLLSTNGPSSSTMALAKAWPGPARSVVTRSIAAVESEKMVQFPLVSCFSQEVFMARRIAEGFTSGRPPCFCRGESAVPSTCPSKGGMAVGILFPVSSCWG